MIRLMPFGDRLIEADLPDGTRVLSPGISLSIPPVEDLARAVREALSHPLDLPPLRRLAAGKRSVTIAFDDPTVPCYAPLWSVALPLILDELAAGGVRRSDVTLVCANALHRQFTGRELAAVLGDELVEEFGDRLRCHDAEDPDGIAKLGVTRSGYHVDLSRLVTDADLTVYLNCSTTRGFSGGWKSICVGLSTYRSIAHHHNPDDMSMSLERNRMHEMLDEMGEVVLERLGRGRIFKLETVLANPMQVAQVFGGTVGATRRAALELNRAAQPPRRNADSEKADIVVYGVPDWSPYAAFSFTNPILTLHSTGLGYLGGMIEAAGKPGCTVVLATPCPDRWDDVHHPAYREVWERVIPVSRDPYRLRERFEREFAARPDYVDRYRTAFAFHPVHAIMALFPLKRLRHADSVIVAGADDPDVVRHAGFEPAASVEDGVAVALRRHGPDARLAFVPYPLAFNRT